MANCLVEGITCGKVQEYLNNYYRNTGEKISFYEAYIQIVSNGIQGKDEKLESFLKWDISRIIEFQDFYHKLLVQTESMKKNMNSKGVSEVVEDFLFPGKDAVILKYAYNTGLDLHLHNYFEIVYVVEGECSQVFEEEERTIKKGEFSFIPPYTVHDILLEEKSIVFGLLIRKSTFEQFFFEILQDNNPLSAFLIRFFMDNARLICTFQLCHQKDYLEFFKIYLKNAICRNLIQIKTA